MRIAVFTNQFPTRVGTFFVRDMRALLAAGCELEVFPLYPPDPALWAYVPWPGREAELPAGHVHHITPAAGLRGAAGYPAGALLGLLPDLAALTADGARFGVGPLAKSVYLIPKALAWAREHAGRFDHALAYWGSYAAHCAYLFHQVSGGRVPYSFFLHAGADLYRHQAFLPQKLRTAERVIVVCEFNRRYLRGLYPELYPTFAPRVVLHHLGLDLDELPYGRDGRPAHLCLGVGRHEHTKGFDDLLRAAALLRRQGVPAEVELVGDGAETGRLRALAADLGIAAHVRFRGWLTFDGVREAIRRASVLVHPSTGVGDAVPTVIKEAMALGTPVVASAVAGIPELLDGGRCGVLTPPRSPVALAAGVGALLRHPGRREHFAAAARAFAEQTFDMWRNGERLARLLGHDGQARAVGE